MRSLSINLATPTQKRYNIQGYGFYLYQYPNNLDGYVIPDSDTARLRPIGIQRLIRYDEKFEYFDFVTTSSHAGEYLKLYVIEDISEFDTLPTQDLNIAFNIAETGFAKETTLSDLNNKVATEATLNNINNNVQHANTDDVICRELAKVIEQNSYILSVYGNTNKDFYLENPIDSGKVLYIDNIEILNAGTTTPSGSPLVTVTSYLNSSYTGTPSSISIFNKTFGSTNTSVAIAEDITGATITPGTKITEVYLAGGQSRLLNYGGLVENNLIHFSITATDYYTITISFHEE